MTRQRPLTSSNRTSSRPVQTGGKETLKAIGIDIDPPAVVAGIYPDMSHAEDWDAAADAASEWVTDDMARLYAEAYCVVGSADYVTNQFQTAVNAGATSFYVRHPGSYTLPDHTARGIRKQRHPPLPQPMNSDQSVDRLWALFQQVIALDMSPGEDHHRVASDDPRLSAFIDKIARPELKNLGASTTTDSMGNLIATFGDRTGDELLLIAYPATHHGNKMADPLHARVVVVDDHNYWAGQGASEGKGPFVSLIDALARSRQDGIELDGRVIVAVSTEGSSTNDSSTVMFDEMSPLPAAAALIIGTENKIALGHRGRCRHHRHYHRHSPPFQRVRRPTQPDR